MMVGTKLAVFGLAFSRYTWFRRNHIGGLQSVKIRRIFRQPNYFSADFRRQ